MTTTLDDYDFESVYEYLNDFMRHVDTETDGDIVLTIIATDRNQGKNCLMGTDKEHIRKILMHSLLSTVSDDDLEDISSNLRDDDTREFFKNILKNA